MEGEVSGATVLRADPTDAYAGNWGAAQVLVSQLLDALAELALEAMKLGAADYLIKPLAPDNLERLIQEILLKGKGGYQGGEGLFLF